MVGKFYGKSEKALKINFMVFGTIKVHGREMGNMTPKQHQSLVRCMLCNHALLIARVSGVWLLEPEVLI